MRVATFNVENLFSRVHAMNSDDPTKTTVFLGLARQRKPPRQLLHLLADVGDGTFVFAGSERFRDQIGDLDTVSGSGRDDRGSLCLTVRDIASGTAGKKLIELSLRQAEQL
jgi:hypothetical protein